jgi:hypothetical protein
MKQSTFCRCHFEDVVFDADVGPLIHAFLDVTSLLALRITCRTAAREGTIGVDLQQSRRLMNICGAERYSEVAAFLGDLRAVQLGHAVGVPWSPFTLVLAAKRGHLDVIIWARQHGCPWDYKTHIVSNAKKHPTVLAWVTENGCV